MIIGGTRRCGPYLVKELLERGHKVICYHRGQHNISFTERAEHLHGDRRDYATFKKQMAKLKVDVVVDMIAGDDGDVRAVAEALRGRIKRYICISSYEVYAAFEAAWKHVPSSHPIPIPEEALKRKELHLYGRERRYDKLLVEQEALAAHERGDFSVTILRWPALYGPRDETPREWYYVKQALDGRKQIAIPAGGQALFPRGYLANMAYTVVLALESERAAGQTYNAADTVALSLRQIVELIGEIMGHRWEIIPVPRRLLPAVPQSQGLPYSCDPYDIEPHLLLDLTKLRGELGYRDLVPVERALENTVRWLRDHPPPEDWLPIDYQALDEAIRKAAPEDAR
ncbi:MAG: NAD-dependent epimerase/dehydratase family protein [Candidatus Methanosuratincola sp.]